MAGDNESLMPWLAEWFSENRRDLLRKARKLTKSDFEAEDLVEESFLRLLIRIKNMPKRPDRLSLSALFDKTIRRTRMDLKERRGKWEDLKSGDFLEVIASKIDSPKALDDYLIIREELFPLRSTQLRRLAHRLETSELLLSRIRQNQDIESENWQYLSMADSLGVPSSEIRLYRLLPSVIYLPSADFGIGEQILAHVKDLLDATGFQIHSESNPVLASYKKRMVLRTDSPVTQAELEERLREVEVSLTAVLCGKSAAETARILAESNRLQADAEKSQAESAKLKAEADKLSAEAMKLNAETGKLRAERYKLVAETAEVLGKAFLKLGIGITLAIGSVSVASGPSDTKSPTVHRLDKDQILDILNDYLPGKSRDITNTKETGHAKSAGAGN